MDWLKAKYYEFLIKRIMKKWGYRNIEFRYSLLVERGFTEKIIDPNTHNRVTIYYKTYANSDRSKTFKHLKQAYNHFK